MKSTLFTFLISALFTLISFSTTEAQNESLRWYTWDEAVEANKTQPKKFVIDLYTDWCGWCKVMDKKTFTDPNVIAYISEHFYPVKFDAEQKADVNWNGHTFKFLEAGRRGIHELAYSLMDGKASYPTLVYLDEKFVRIMISPGYKTPDQLDRELRYTEEGAYKTTKFEEFQ